MVFAYGICLRRNTMAEIFFCRLCGRNGGLNQYPPACDNCGIVMIPQAVAVTAAAKLSFRLIKWTCPFGKNIHFAEGQFQAIHIGTEMAKMVARLLLCPCGCGTPQAVKVMDSNCAEARVQLKYFCTAQGTFRLFDEDNTWDAEIEIS
jgi:hypothetical protein